MPYPVRSLRTRDFLYTINFKPDRWPAGDPASLSDGQSPSSADWQKSTYTGYADIDAFDHPPYLVASKQKKQAKK